MDKLKANVKSEIFKALDGEQEPEKHISKEQYLINELIKGFLNNFCFVVFDIY